MLGPVGVLENKSRNADLTPLPKIYYLWIRDTPLHKPQLTSLQQEGYRRLYSRAMEMSDFGVKWVN